MADNLLSMFDTESASESGSWLHLAVPGTDGDLAYDGKGNPLRIKLKGPDSDVWTEFQRKAMRHAGKKDTRSAKEVAKEDAHLFARITLDVENIPGYDKPDREKLVEMYTQYKDIRIQSLRYLMNQENFIGKSLTD
jgi:hypothetical protein